MGGRGGKGDKSTDEDIFQETSEGENWFEISDAYDVQKWEKRNVLRGANRTGRFLAFYGQLLVGFNGQSIVLRPMGLNAVPVISKHSVVLAGDVETRRRFGWERFENQDQRVSKDTVL